MDPPAKRVRIEATFRPWRLLRTDGLDAAGNVGSVTLAELVDGGAASPDWVVLSSFMIDPIWLTSAWPGLFRDVRRIVMFHGSESNKDVGEKNMNFAPGSHVERVFLTPRYPDGAQFRTHLGKMAHINYGCYHAKFILIGFPTGIRVIVTSANFIYSDFQQKSNGVYCQDFPLKQPPSAAAASTTTTTTTSPFEESLVDYIQTILRVKPECGAARSTPWPCSATGAASSASSSSASLEVPLNVLLRRYDFSRAYGHLVATVPGFHLRNGGGPDGKRDDRLKYGHMRVRSLLEREEGTFPPELVNVHRGGASSTPPQCHVQQCGGTRRSDVICQFSSWGIVSSSYGRSLQASFSAGSARSSASSSASSSSAAGSSSAPSSSTLATPLGKAALGFVWPTQTQLRHSVEGYSAGRSLPSTPKAIKSVSNARHHLRLWNGACRGSGATGCSDDEDEDGGGSALVRARCAAVPHLKSYARVSLDGRTLAWSLLTSANISSFAHGVLQLIDKEKEHLKCGHWELGVLFTPTSLLKRWETSEVLFSCCAGSSGGKRDGGGGAAVMATSSSVAASSSSSSSAGVAPPTGAACAARTHAARKVQAEAVAFVAQQHLSGGCASSTAEITGWLAESDGDVKLATRRAVQASEAAATGGVSVSAGAGAGGHGSAVSAAPAAPGSPRVTLRTTAGTDKSPLPPSTSTHRIALVPLPFELPLRTYAETDIPWSTGSRPPRGKTRAPPVHLPADRFGVKHCFDERWDHYGHTTGG